ncbi:MAG: helix-turn-helix transcriptional regulator [Bacteroidia bacterium]
MFSRGLTFRLFFLFAIGLLYPIVSQSQTLDSKAILDKFKDASIEQTNKFGLVNLDLHLNFNEKTFLKRIKEMSAYVKREGDLRLRIRLFLYERSGNPRLTHHASQSTTAAYFEMIRLASILEDEQLLSELYVKVALILPTKNQLYYLLKASEIRERIGLAYFDDMTTVYYVASVFLYQIGNYSESAKFSEKCLASYKESEKKTLFIQYVLAADMAGASNLNLGNAGKAIRYYQEIDSLVRDYRIRPHGYQPVQRNALEIWEGVSKGGIGRAKLIQRDYRSARHLLLQNLASSRKFAQWSNVAQVEYSLAQIDQVNGNFSAALKQYLNAYRLSDKNLVLATAIHAAEGAAKLFSVQKQFDSAYVYTNKYIGLQKQLDEKIKECQLEMLTNQVKFEQSQKALITSKNNLQNQKRIRNFLLVGIVLVTAIVLLIYNRERLRLKFEFEKSARQAEVAQAEVALAQKEIDLFVQNLSEKNRLISQLQDQVSKEKSSALQLTLNNFTILTDQDWRKFKSSFETVNPQFMDRMFAKMPKITQGEQRIMMLAKLGFSTKEMANATGVSPETIRSVMSRMRKKFDMDIDIQSFAERI